VFLLNVAFRWDPNFFAFCVCRQTIFAASALKEPFFILV
jgi:hypothetical protein